MFSLDITTGSENNREKKKRTIIYVVCLTPAIANKLHFAEVKQIKHI